MPSQLSLKLALTVNEVPLLRPALANIYDKMRGKSNQSAQIFVNKAVHDDLTWFTNHIETSSGVYLFSNMDWDPLVEFDSVIYGDACLEGMGFWVPDSNLGLAGKTDTSSPMAHLIFYWEALTILAALQWLVTSPSCRGSAEQPYRFTFCSDSSNTVNMFNSLRALPNYNPILIAAVDILLEFHINLCVVHILGHENVVANALSHFDFNAVRVLHPDITILPLETPRLTLGAEKK